jgi:hypothetical protein
MLAWAFGAAIICVASKVGDGDGDGMGHNWWRTINSLLLSSLSVCSQKLIKSRRARLIAYPTKRLAVTGPVPGLVPGGLKLLKHRFWASGE